MEVLLKVSDDGEKKESNLKKQDFWAEFGKGYLELELLEKKTQYKDYKIKLDQLKIKSHLMLSIYTS